MSSKKNDEKRSHSLTTCPQEPVEAPELLPRAASEESSPAPLSPELERPQEPIDLSGLPHEKEFEQVAWCHIVRFWLSEHLKMRFYEGFELSEASIGWFLH